MTGHRAHRVTMITERTAVIEAPNEAAALFKATAWFVDHPEHRPDVKFIVEPETARKG